jgi:hypothetical protein
MRRREFVTLLGGAAAAWPLAARAQQPGKLPLIGVLVSASPPHPFADAFWRGLHALAYSEGSSPLSGLIAVRLSTWPWPGAGAFCLCVNSAFLCCLSLREKSRCRRPVSIRFPQRPMGANFGPDISTEGSRGFFFRSAESDLLSGAR